VDCEHAIAHWWSVDHESFHHQPNQIPYNITDISVYQTQPIVYDMMSKLRRCHIHDTQHPDSDPTLDSQPFSFTFPLVVSLLFFLYAIQSDTIQCCFNQS